MNKTALLGIAAFGGLLLVAGIALNGNNENTSTVNTPEPAQQEQPVQTLPKRVTDAGIPIYPGSTPVNVRESSDERADFVSTSLSAQATIAEVNAWYRDALSQNGWTKTSDKNVAGYQIIQGENENLFTSLQTANGNTEGEVLISQQIQFRK